MSLGLGFVGGIILSSFLAVLLVGGALSFAFGVWMLLRPDQALRFNQRASTWVSMERLATVMDKRRSTERLVYHYHLVYGALLLAAGLFTLYVMSGGRWGRNVVTTFSLGEWSWLVSDVTTLLMITIGLLATVLGIIILIRPSLLRGVEAQLNRWINTDDDLKVLDSVHYAPDRFASRHARSVAAVIAIGSLYALVALVPLLRTPL